MSQTSSAASPRNTLHLKRVGKHSSHEAASSTNYELSQSTVLPPAMKLVDPSKEVRSGLLDPETLTLFQQRLRLCCYVTSAMIAFFFFSALTGSIDMFRRDTVGITGVCLAGASCVSLLALGIFLPHRRTLSENALRAFEIGIFGAIGLFFAYWQFALLTSNSLGVVDEEGFPDMRTEQYFTLAAAMIVHFNWFALLILHGVLVPNTLARGAGVALGVVLSAMLIDIICTFLHDPVRRQWVMLTTISVTLLLAGAALSIFGTAKTAALRQEVATAKQAMREMGQYRLRRKLGHGGMGEVFLAEHRLFKRQCALKRIHPKFLHSSEQMKRFEREVQAMVRLRHPNTVVVYDYGRADDGTFFYVMEYLPCLSIEELVNRYGPMPSERVVHLLIQVCGALREAHRNGLVHRDIKPSNILVYREGSPHDQAKVVDFGLVQTLADIDGAGKITRDGLIVGTPEYMSPEQAQGLALDERSDLFSLGSVAYFMLTGREIFHRDNPVKTLLAVVNDEPRPLEEYPLQIPADVIAVINKCLIKSPERRFLRASDLEESLLACKGAHEWTEKKSLDWWALHPEADRSNSTDLHSLPSRDSHDESRNDLHD